MLASTAVQPLQSAMCSTVEPMGAEGEREELSRLVQQLPDEDVPAVLSDLRRRVKGARPWPPAFFGIEPGDGSRVGAEHDEILAGGFGRS